MLINLETLHLFHKSDTPQAACLSSRPNRSQTMKRVASFICWRALLWVAMLSFIPWWSFFMLRNDFRAFLMLDYFEYDFAYIVLAGVVLDLIFLELHTREYSWIKKILNRNRGNLPKAKTPLLNLIASFRHAIKAAPVHQSCQPSQKICGKLVLLACN